MTPEDHALIMLATAAFQISIWLTDRWTASTKKFFKDLPGGKQFHKTSGKFWKNARFSRIRKKNKKKTESKNEEGKLGKRDGLFFRMIRVCAFHWVSFEAYVLFRFSAEAINLCDEQRAERVYSLTGLTVSSSTFTTMYDRCNYPNGMSNALDRNFRRRVSTVNQWRHYELILEYFESEEATTVSWLRTVSESSTFLRRREQENYYRFTVARSLSRLVLQA